MTNQDEDWFKNKWQQAFEEKFEIDVKLEFVFIDSHFDVDMDPDDIEISKNHFLVRTLYFPSIFFIFIASVIKASDL